MKLEERTTKLDCKIMKFSVHFCEFIKSKYYVTLENL